MKARHSIFILFFAVLVCASLVNAQTTRINVGGPTYTDSHGNVWAADEDFSASSTFSTSHAITGTSDPTLYQTQRYAGASGTNGMTATIPLANGTYQVNLGFSELTVGTVGGRKFNIKINGAYVLTGLDVFAKVGQFAADIESFPVTVSNGSLVIYFENSVNYAIANDIEIVQTNPISVSVAPSASTVPISGTATFTATVTNDNANAGVTWTAQFGSVLPTSSASGAQVTYTAPATVPAGGSDTVTAKSVTDTTKSGTATVTIEHQVALSWQDSINPSGTVTYTVSRATAPCGTSYTTLASGLSALAYTDTTISAGATYCYAIQAVLVAPPNTASGFPLIVTVNVQ